MVHLVGFTIEIRVYYDAWPYERQISYRTLKNTEYEYKMYL
jgi:hypothetical protein